MKLSLIADLAIPVVERIVLLQEDLNDPLHYLNVDVSWFAAERIRLHICDFHGDVDAGRMPLTSGLGRICAGSEAFSLSTVGAQFAPSESRPRLAVVRHDAPEALLSLRTSTVALRDELGLGSDELSWSPVSGFGRISAASDRLQGVLRPYAETALGKSDVSELALVSSRIVRGRAETRVERRFVLGGASRPSRGAA